MKQTIELLPKVAEFFKGEKKLFINGEWVESINGQTFETRNPATGEVLDYVHEAEEEDVNRAVEAAREAFDHGPWSRNGAV